MTITTTTHLNFRGQAREALEFYAAASGGETRIATYADFGMPPEAPGADHVVFGQVVSPDGFRIMAYDIPGPAAAVSLLRGDLRRESEGNPDVATRTRSPPSWTL